MTPTTAQGLPGRGSVEEITRDRGGRLWVMASGGILVLSREDLDATPDQIIRPVHLFGVKHSIDEHESVAGFVAYRPSREPARG